MSTEYTYNDSVGSILVNAVADIALDQNALLSDDTSRTVISEAYETALRPDQRDQFKTALREVQADQQQAEVDDIVDTSIAEVSQALIQNDVKLTVEHTVTIEFDQREAWLYRVIQSGDPVGIEALELSPDVRREIKQGVDSLNAADPESAAERFTTAIGKGTTTDDKVTSRVLAAWANYLAGEPERALDFAEEALHLHTGSFTTRLVILLADHNSTDHQEQNELNSKLYIRTQANVETEGGIQIEVFGSDTGRQITSNTGYIPLSWIESETRIRFTLSGYVDSFPELHAYYLALGLVDEDRGIPRSVEKVFAEGPDSAVSTETVRFET
ncbi:tetratricopeptide repeat protein [Halostella salina]|uniref:tetratricopeptide repeat protein n=1 Tax=Halostella salina TaxID=1547897 RepID=UPI000EF81BF8|nr:tetratricopeptide repeat protein [Halostella salina]